MGLLARPVDEQNRERVRKEILEKSHGVFAKKGYSAVTMTDLITAAGMSRGGFYFYYKSVEEIFRDVFRYRKSSHVKKIKQQIEENKSFSELLEDFFQLQKQQLLNMDSSLMRSLYEYLFIPVNEDSDLEFRNEIKDNLLEVMRTIMNYGVKSGTIQTENSEMLSDHFMVTIEGLYVIAAFLGISESRIDQQFQTLREMLYWID